MRSRRSLALHRPDSGFYTVHVQCERAWQKMSRAFFARFDKRCHVFLPLISAKNVASSSGQAVTLLYLLYLLSSSLAMFSRKEVLDTGIEVSLEFGYAREPRKAQAVKIALIFKGSLQQMEIRTPLHVSRHPANAGKTSQTNSRAASRNWSATSSSKMTFPTESCSARGPHSSRSDHSPSSPAISSRSPSTSLAPSAIRSGVASGDQRDHFLLSAGLLHQNQARAHGLIGPEQEG